MAWRRRAAAPPQPLTTLVPPTAAGAPSSSPRSATAEAVTNGIVTSPIFRLSYDTDNVRGRNAAVGLRAGCSARLCWVSGRLPAPPARYPTLPRGRAVGARARRAAESLHTVFGMREQRAPLPAQPARRAAAPEDCAPPPPGCAPPCPRPPQESPDLTRSWKKTMKIAVTGAAGQISNHLL